MAIGFFKFDLKMITVFTLTMLGLTTFKGFNKVILFQKI